jgi:hypothetical protein
VLDADFPLAAFLAAQRHDIAADVDQRVVDALAAQDGGGAVEGDAFQVAAEVERDLAVAAGDGVAVMRQIGNRRLAGQPGLDFGRRGIRP